MFAPHEIRRSLVASWQLFRGRADGLALLDRTVEGFWRSFAAILLVLPVNAVTMLAVSRIDDTDQTVGHLILDGLPVLVTDWVAFPVLLALAARPLGVTGTYVSYVVARNWAAPLAAALLMVPFLLEGAGWTSPPVTAFLSVISLGLVLRLHFVILRLALRTEIGPSAALVLADVIVTLVIVALFG